VSNNEDRTPLAQEAAHPGDSAATGRHGNVADIALVSSTGTRHDNEPVEAPARDRQDTATPPAYVPAYARASAPPAQPQDFRQEPVRSTEPSLTLAQVRDELVAWRRRLPIRIG
jgi:hypothetical protein